jgi:hypothetical protein
METPPELPAPSQPLGRQFYILLLLPLALIAISFCCVNSGNLAVSFFGASALAALVCSILLAGKLSRRISQTGDASIGMSILMFFALQAFYAVCFFVGCTAAVALS